MRREVRRQRQMADGSWQMEYREATMRGKTKERRQ
jgi:hypothetical protein